MTWCNRLRFISKFIYLCFLVSLKYIICINWLFEYTCPTLLTLYMTWCIRSWIEDPSHGFLVEWWVVHSQFMDLGYPYETVVHYLLIRGMTCLGCHDCFPMVSVLVHVICIGYDLQWIMTQCNQLSWFTKLLYCMESQPWEDIEFMPKLTRSFDLYVRP